MATRLAAFDVLVPPNPDNRDLVRISAVPIPLVLGEKGVVSPETAQELQALNPKLRYNLIPDVGHGLAFDRPDLLAQVARAFLRSLPAA